MTDPDSLAYRIMKIQMEENNSHLMEEIINAGFSDFEQSYVDRYISDEQTYNQQRDALYRYYTCHISSEMEHLSYGIYVETCLQTFLYRQLGERCQFNVRRKKQEKDDIHLRISAFNSKLAEYVYHIPNEKYYEFDVLIDNLIAVELKSQYMLDEHRATILRYKAQCVKYLHYLNAPAVFLLHIKNSMCYLNVIYLDKYIICDNNGDNNDDIYIPLDNYSIEIASSFNIDVIDFKKHNGYTKKQFLSLLNTLIEIVNMINTGNLINNTRLNK